jgi:hypothetical protein
VFARSDFVSVHCRYPHKPQIYAESLQQIQSDVECTLYELYTVWLPCFALAFVFVIGTSSPPVGTWTNRGETSRRYHSPLAPALEFRACLCMRYPSVAKSLIRHAGLTRDGNRFRGALAPAAFSSPSKDLRIL